MRLQPPRIDPFALIDAMPQLVWIADPAGNLVYFNARWREYTGLSLDASLAGAWVEALHPDDTSTATATWNAALACGEQFDTAYRLRSADGDYREMIGRGAPMRDDAGTIVQWVGTLTDVHELKSVESGLSLLSRASAAVAESLDLERTLDVLLELVIPAFGDWGLINVREDDGRIRAVAVRHADPNRADDVAALRGQIYHAPDGALGATAVYETGEAQIIEHARFDLAESVLPEFVGVHERLGLGWGLNVPIIIDGSVVGTLGIVSSGTRRIYSQAELSLLEELATRAGFAVQNAHRFAQRYRAAHALQEGALPRTLPDVPGVDLQGYYAAAVGDTFVGGDWYDALRLDDGRVIVSIGDVAGNGIDAAVTMAGVRQLLRVAAQIDLEPLEMLAAADRMLRNDSPDCYVTAFVGILDPATLSLRYASAGHPPPLLRRADGGIEELEGGHGLPLGLRTPATSKPAAVRGLDPGSLLVLYSDGLIEASKDALGGLRALRSALKTAPPPGQSAKVAVDLVKATLEGGEAHDDVAVLTIGITPLVDGDSDGDATLVRWSFDADDTSAIAQIRRSFARRFARLGANEDDSIAALTVFGELVANAARHGAGLVEVVLDSGAPLPILHVLDRGPSFEHTPLRRPDVFAESGRGLYIVSQLARDFRVGPRHDGGTHARATLDLQRRRKARL